MAVANATQRTTRIPLEELAKTAPGTLMGRLLRRFWQPVAVSAEVPVGWAIPIQVMDENLTLYRGRGGAPYIVAARCAHRLSLLHTGWVDEDTLRCMYHGWRYDGRGQCVEMPAEDPAAPPKVRIASQPARDYGGLVFAYLGEGEPPPFDLPCHDELERPGGLHWVQRQVWGCSWFQAIENSMDATHVSFVHRWGRLGPFGAAVSDVLPKLEYAETETGIRQTATRAANNVRISDWTFPNHNHIVVPGYRPDDPWTHTFAWVLPLDDEHVLRCTQQYAAVEDDAAERLRAYLLAHGYETTDRPDTYFGRTAYDPAQHHEDLFLRRICPEPATNELTSAQDYVAQVGQGPIVDRRHERLGRSDAGILFLRSIFTRELAALRDGRPLKEWRRTGPAQEMPTQPGAATPGDGWDHQGVTAGAQDSRTVR